MVDAVKETLNVDVNDPVVAPATLARRLNRVDRRAPRSVAIGVRVEHWFQQGLQVPSDNLLSDAVGNRGNTQRSRSTISLWDVHSAHRGRHVAARGQPVPELVKVVGKPHLEVLNR